MKKLIVFVLAILLAGCAGANISSQIRETAGDKASMVLRCIEFKTGNVAENNQKIQEYDGWKMVYISEYTTPNKLHSDVVMCFEKPAQ